MKAAKATKPKLDFRSVSNVKSMDIIFIRELKVETVIGVYKWERKIKQPILIDLEMAVDIRKAAQSDDLNDTVDYKVVAARITDLIHSSECHLLEYLAEHIAEALQKEFSISWLKLRISKPDALAQAAAVGVMIERERSA